MAQGTVYGNVDGIKLQAMFRNCKIIMATKMVVIIKKENNEIVA